MLNRQPSPLPPRDYPSLASSASLVLCPLHTLRSLLLLHHILPLFSDRSSLSLSLALAPLLSLVSSPISPILQQSPTFFSSVASSPTLSKGVHASQHLQACFQLLSCSLLFSVLYLLSCLVFSSCQKRPSTTWHGLAPL